MKAPIGAEVGIHYDGRVVYVGDALVTPTGRTYLVISVRYQAKGAHRGRQHLRCLVAEYPPPQGAWVLPLIWYKRGGRRRARG